MLSKQHAGFAGLPFVAKLITHSMQGKLEVTMLCCPNLVDMLWGVCGAV